MLVEKYIKDFGKYEIVVYVEKTVDGYQKGVEAYFKDKLISGMFITTNTKTLDVFQYYEDGYNLIPNLRDFEKWEEFIKEWHRDIEKIRRVNKKGITKILDLK